MGTALRTAVSRCITFLVLLLLLAGIIWLVFSFWRYQGLLILLGVAVVAAVIGMVVFFIRRNRREEVDPERIALEIQKRRVNDYFKACMKRLKKKFGRRWDVYSQPWFLIAGEALAGKRTLLRSMGLESMESPDYAGVACTLWINEDILVVELAARCFEEERSELRQHIMYLLRRKRPRQPLNGILQSLRLNDVCGQTRDDINIRGEMLRQRLTEINNSLDMNLPVYLLFNQADHLADLYESVSGWLGEELEQPLGDFRTANDASELVTEWFENSWHRLINQVAMRFRQSLHNDHFPERKPSVMALPLQMALAGPCIQNLMESLLSTSVLYKPLRIQGYMLTSCSQDGERVDLLSRHLAGEYGFSSRSVTMTGIASHQLFARTIPHLILKPCAPLAGFNERSERLFQIFRISAYTLLLLAGSSFIGWVLLSLWHEDELRGETLSRLVVYNAEMTEQVKHKDNDIINLISLLAYLRQTYEDYRHQPDWYMFRPLLERETGVALKSSYHIQLKELLLPRAIAMTEQFIRDQIKAENPVELLQGVVLYQMLFDESELIIGDLSPFLVERFQCNTLPESAVEQLEALIRDLFKEQGYPTFLPNSQLLTESHTKLNSYPEDLLAYLWLRNQPKNAKRLNTATLLGSHFKDIFYLAPEAKELPQVFMRERFRQLDLSYQSKTLNHTQDYYERLHDIPADSRSRPEELQYDVDLSRRVSERYFDDYITHWQKVLGAVRVNYFHSLTEMRTAFKLLSAKDTSPLQQIFEVTVDNTRLVDTKSKDKKPGEKGAEGAGESKGEVAKRLLPEQSKENVEAADKALQSLSRKLKPAEALEVRVDNTFQPYRVMVASSKDSAGSLGAQIQQQMQKLYEYVSKVVEADYPGESAFKQASAHAAGKKDPLSELRRLAGLAPDPVSHWLYNMCDQCWAQLLQQTHGWINDRWQVDLYPEWERTMGGFFPFNVTSKREVDINNFIDFLKPGGHFDTFFKKHLQPFVINRDGKMKLGSFDGKQVAIAESTISQLQLLKTIQHRFFPVSDGKLSISYSLRESYLTPKHPGSSS